MRDGTALIRFPLGSKGARLSRDCYVRHGESASRFR
jgi:hypothetical protein